MHYQGANLLISYCIVTCPHLKPLVFTILIQWPTRCSQSKHRAIQIIRSEYYLDEHTYNDSFKKWTASLYLSHLSAFFSGTIGTCLYSPLLVVFIVAFILQVRPGSHDTMERLFPSHNLALLLQR